VWECDDAKLERVRTLMAERDLDALVVRAPDNVLYLTNFWGMKGYDACVFPREGEPVLLCLEASEEDAAHMSWTSDVRLLQGYAPDDPRPVPARTLDAALAAAKDYGRVGLELSMGTQASDRMVGEPTTFTKAWFDAWPGAQDAMSVLVPARSIKTAQEIERLRLANEICAAAMEHVRGEIKVGMKESEVAAIWQGFVHGQGTGWDGRSSLRLASRSSGPGAASRRSLQRATCRSSRANRRCSRSGSAPTATGRPHQAPLHRRAASRLPRARRGPVGVYNSAIDYCEPAAEMAALDVLVRNGIEELGYPGQPSHPICHGVGARAHEPPYPHQAGGGTIEAGMVFAIEPVLLEGGGGLRVEDNFLITETGAEKLSSFPDGVVFV